MACSLRGEMHVALHQRFEARPVLGGGHRLDVHHLQVALGVEELVLVEHVGDAAAHARGEVHARPAQHHDDAAGHVLAAVVAHALHHGDGAGVAHREALARPCR